MMHFGEHTTKSRWRHLQTSSFSTKSTIKAKSGQRVIYTVVTKLTISQELDIQM